MKKTRVISLIMIAAFLLTSVSVGSVFAEKGSVEGKGKNRIEDSTVMQEMPQLDKEGIKARKEELKQKRRELKFKMNDDCLDIEIEEEDEIELEADALTQGDGTMTEEVHRERTREGLKKIAFRLGQDIENATENQKLKLAVALIKIDEFDKALKIVEEIIADDPTNQKALVIMAKIYRETEDYDKAVETVKDIVEKFPHAKVKAFLGILHSENEDIDEARKMLEEAIKQQHKTRELYKELGKVYEKLGEKGYKVFVKGKRPEFDVEPVAHNGRILVPIRAIAESLGTVVTYNPEDKSITMEKGDTKVVFWIGSDKALINGTEVELDVEPLVKNERTLVPVRFISEAFNTEVTYDAEIETVIIESKGDEDEDEFDDEEDIDDEEDEKDEDIDEDEDVEDVDDDVEDEEDVADDVEEHDDDNEDADEEKEEDNIIAQ